MRYWFFEGLGDENVNNYISYDSVSQMQTNLGWRSPDQRKADARFCMLYTIVHDLVAIQLPPYFQQPSTMTRQSAPASSNSYFCELLQMLLPPTPRLLCNGTSYQPMLLFCLHCLSLVWQLGLLTTSYPRRNMPVFKPHLLLTSYTFICFSISLLHFLSSLFTFFHFSQSPCT